MTFSNTTHVAIGCLALAVSCSLASAAAPTPPATATATTTPATSAAMDPFSRDLLARLNSNNAAQREAAQKEIAAIVGLWQQPAILQKMIDATSDPELKVVLQQRFNFLMYRQLQFDFSHQPPISLSVKNANMKELATALGAATKSEPYETYQTDKASFTLDINQKPFWEVLVALSRLTPLTLESRNALRPDAANIGIRHYAIDGPAIAFVRGVTYRRDAVLQVAAGDPSVRSSLSAAITIAVDPRLRVVRFYATTISATDDMGHNIAAFPVSTFETSGNPWTFSHYFTPPTTPGKIMTMVIDCHVSAAAETIYPLNDVANHPNASVLVNGATYQITRFDVVANSSIAMSLKIAHREPISIPAAVLLDGTGKELWSGWPLDTVNVNINKATMGPYRLEWHIPDKNIDLPVHFEIKDIPLP